LIVVLSYGEASVEMVDLGCINFFIFILLLLFYYYYLFIYYYYYTVLFFSLTWQLSTSTLDSRNETKRKEYECWDDDTHFATMVSLSFYLSQWVWFLTIFYFSCEVNEFDFFLSYFACELQIIYIWENNWIEKGRETQI